MPRLGPCREGRVYDLCLFIGREEGGDLETPKIASMLHDIARDMERGDHAAKSAEEAGRILLALGLGRTKISKIVDAIKTHRFRGRAEPQTLEAKILSDADKLDAMGAMGIYRAHRSARKFEDHFKGPSITSTKNS